MDGGWRRPAGGVASVIVSRYSRELEKILNLAAFNIFVGTEGVTNAFLLSRFLQCASVPSNVDEHVVSVNRGIHTTIMHQKVPRIVPPPLQH